MESRSGDSDSGGDVGWDQQEKAGRGVQEGISNLNVPAPVVPAPVVNTLTAGAAPSPPLMIVPDAATAGGGRPVDALVQLPMTPSSITAQGPEGETLLAPDPRQPPPPPFHQSAAMGIMTGVAPTYLAALHFPPLRPPPHHHPAMTGLPMAQGPRIPLPAEVVRDPLPPGITFEQLKQDYALPVWSQVRADTRAGSWSSSLAFLLLGIYLIFDAGKYHVPSSKCSLSIPSCPKCLTRRSACRSGCWPCHSGCWP